LGIDVVTLVNDRRVITVVICRWQWAAESPTWNGDRANK